MCRSINIRSNSSSWIADDRPNIFIKCGETIRNEYGKMGNTQIYRDTDHRTPSSGSQRKISDAERSYGQRKIVFDSLRLSAFDLCFHLFTICDLRLRSTRRTITRLKKKTLSDIHNSQVTITDALTIVRASATIHHSQLTIIQNSIPCCANIPAWNGCLISFISVTKSAASTSSGGAFRPVTMI